MDVAKRLAGKPARSIAYDMRCFFRQVVDKYLQHSGEKANNLKVVQMHWFQAREALTLVCHSYRMLLTALDIQVVALS